MLNTKVRPKISRPEAPTPPRSVFSNGVILLLSAGLLLWAHQLLQNKFTRVTSRDAVINGRLVDLNAPIEGTVTDLVQTGTVIQKDQSLLAIANDKVSELKVQEIKGEINELAVTRQQALNQLDRLLNLQAIWHERQATDDTMQSLGKQQAIEEAYGDLKATESKLKLADVTYARSQDLADSGVVPRADLDEATFKKEELENQRDGLLARIEKLKTDKEATAAGLTLNRSSSAYDPRIQLQDLETQIADKQLEIKTIDQQIVDAKAALVKAETDVKNTMGRTVNAPTPGVIWKITAQKGQFVEKGDPLGQLLDCNQRWVDAVVDEQAVAQLFPGMNATIELNGDKNHVLTGRVGQIRSGMGRLQVGQDTAVPIAPNMPRSTQVRVELDPQSDRGSSEVMCYVGYTGKVTFKR